MTLIKSLTACLVMVVALSGHAMAGWKHNRESAMTLRERGQPVAAYKSAMSNTSSRPRDVFDRNFVAGWIALEKLNRPDISIKHFAEMASVSPKLKAEKRASAKSKSGYWLGKALSKQGNSQGAKAAMQAAARYPNTFYGQLASAELGIRLDSTRLSHVKERYPFEDYRWTDNRVRKEFVLAVIREESRFNERAKSHAGAVGLMQLMPGTARDIGKNHGVKVDMSLLGKDKDYNVIFGSNYLADQYLRYNGNAMLAAAAYNAGPANVDEWLRRFGDPRSSSVDPVTWAESIPFSETRNYVQKVISSYVTYLSLGIP
ncbi:lytic transglycosylase domain-containing protein [Roseibium sp. RKSG952]|uniref:lytic transglycosylase domain-containing protein n=1 Tax=Roseibium sp. RKSG952 TaxID=2529384 RepID=UPI0018AD29D3|nr:lytic transglycosylase domain-containing protein [Roseibium sp. RKSG952]